MRRLLSILTVTAAMTAASAQVPAGWQHYSGRGFAIDYPPGWTVDPSFLDKGYGFFQGDTDDVRGGVAFAPGGDIAPGTNLESDQLKLVVQLARPGDLCTASSFLVDPSPNYDTQKLVDKPDRVRTFAEPGDRYAVEQAVLLVSKAPCIAVHYYIAYARTGAAHQVDREQLYRLLGAIASTVKPGP